MSQVEITVTEVRKKKTEVEQEISQALQQFYLDTGFRIESVNIESKTIQFARSCESESTIFEVNLKIVL